LLGLADHLDHQGHTGDDGQSAEDRRPDAVHASGIDGGRGHFGVGQLGQGDEDTGNGQGIDKALHRENLQLRVQTRFISLTMRPIPKDASQVSKTMEKPSWNESALKKESSVARFARLSKVNIKKTS